MGLDWILHGHVPKPGHEAQYRRIKNKLDRLDIESEVPEHQRAPLRRDLETALEQEALSPFEVVGAPQVGLDAEATEWFRTNVYLPTRARVAAEKLKPTPRDPNKPQWEDRNEAFLAHWDRPFEELVQAERGKYVVELAKEREGIAAITGFLCSALDFRGKAIGLSGVLDDDLKNEAYDDHDADACLDYADRLEAAVADYKVDRSGEVSAKEDIADVEAAVRWLRYWGSRGFGYRGWY